MIRVEPTQADIDHATRQADEFGLPQTVLWREDWRGFANTNSLSRLIDDPKAVLSVTVLPKNYFH